MHKVLSIVIPVYKVEKFIRQCLDSVIVSPEEMEQIEVIVVNDGTPDNSSVIAHEYAEKYPNSIKVIDKENGGHGSAWNVGLKLATGKYLRFLDSDDWLSNLSEFISILKTLDTDFVFTNINKYYEDSNKNVIEKVKGVKYNTIYDHSSFSYLQTNNKYEIYDFWFCTYKTELLQKEQPMFVEKVFYDDAILFLSPLFLGNTMTFLDLTLYNYRLGRIGQSVSKKSEMAHYKDYIKVCEKLVDFSNKHLDISANQKEQRDQVFAKYIRNRVSLFTCLPYKDYKDSMKSLMAICRKAPYIKSSPKMFIYKATGPYISWNISKFINKYILKI